MPAWLVDERGTIVYANPAYDRTLRPPHCKAVGLPLDDLYGPEYAQEYHRNNARVLATNAEVEVLEPLLMPDGTIGTYLVRKFPVGVGGQRWVAGIAANITELKRTEVRLEETVARWQLAMEGAADGVWEWNVVTDEVVLSPQWMAMLGYSEGEIVPSFAAWEERIHPEDRAALLSALEAHLQSKTSIYQCEHRLRHRDGHYVWILNRGKVIERDASGQPLRMVGTHTDISDRKTAELALRQSEARFMAISDASPATIYILVQRPDGGFYFEHMSRSVEDIHEVPVEAVLANASLVLDHIHPDDRATYNAAVQRSLETLSPFSHEWRIVTPSGALKWLQGRSQPRRRANGEIAWYGVVIDITDLKRSEVEHQQTVLKLQHSLDRLVATQAALRASEARLSSVLNSSLDGIMVFESVRDQAGQIVDFTWQLGNPAAWVMVRRRAEDLIGKRLLEEMPGHRLDGLFDYYVGVVTTGIPGRKQFKYSHEGIDAWFENVAVRLGDGFVTNFRDITERIEADLALQVANQQLEAQVALLHQRNTDMQLLGALSNTLQTCQSAADAYPALTQLLQPMFPGCGGGLLAQGQQTAPAAAPALEVVVRWGSLPDPKQAFDPSACLALQRRSSLWVDPAQANQRCCHLGDRCADQSTFCIPVGDQTKTLGLLYLHSDDPAALSPVKRQLAQTVADQIALALTNLSLRDLLRHQSTRDPLTDLYNRRYLEESLTQEIVAAQRKAKPIGVLMLDLDHFKDFNDTYGHGAGDRALQAVAQLLKDNVRGSDIACRYGGEEIILILPGSALGETQRRAEELRRAIAALPQPEGATGLTASLGVACFPDHGTTLEALLKAADVALYAAKQQGRNQVVVAGA
jgi:diguanylate cyclase (GGDEF)-like protein/PAS domain S-box-containing protein